MAAAAHARLLPPQALLLAHASLPIFAPKRRGRPIRSMVLAELAIYLPSLDTAASQCWAHLLQDGTSPLPSVSNFYDDYSNDHCTQLLERV